MRMQTILTLFALALPISDQRGAVSAVTVGKAVSGEAAVLTVRGSNPCTTLLVDYGDGTEAAQTVRGLPATISKVYADPGTYQVRVRGTGTCGGSTTARVVVAAGTSTGAGTDRALGQARFRAMDTNLDGRITRAEWRGSVQSFNVHDWNGDGVLSGNEVTPGGQRPQASDDNYIASRFQMNNWSAQNFQQLDHNRDNRISSDEWHYDIEAFVRADRNRDGVISRAEFLDTAVDDDRDDRFDYLDVNGDNRVSRDEWHSSVETFNWLDRNRDGALTRTEMLGETAVNDDQFASLDINRDRAVTLNEWHWSRASFNQLDRNRDGRLTEAEFDAGGPLSTTGSATINVPATERWTDTGIYVRAGDELVFNASGTVRLSSVEDIADPQGSRTGRRAGNAPIPEESAGMLIARIGNEVQPVGASRTIRAASAGRLYLSVNDDHMADNSGAFRVTVRVTR